MRNNLVVGDKVDVFLDEQNALLALEILYIPCSTGDSWHLKDGIGTLYYIQTFQYMKLLK